MPTHSPVLSVLHQSSGAIHQPPSRAGLIHGEYLSARVSLVLKPSAARCYHCVLSGWVRPFKTLLEHFSLIGGDLNLFF